MSPYSTTIAPGRGCADSVATQEVPRDYGNGFDRMGRMDRMTKILL
jgi:hypothetical protein